MSATGRWTRVSLGMRAALAAVLAVGAAVLAIDLSDWRYARIDLTARRSNTLDPSVLDVLDRLPEPVVVDAFLRPLLEPYRALQAEAADRTLELLTIVRNARRSQVEVRLHDPKDFEAIQERQRELGTEGTNKLVFSCGERRAEVELFGELATIDWGNPNEKMVAYLVGQGIPGVVDPRTWQPGRPFRPARVLDFHGEELLAEALLKVASGSAPKVCFLKGHGEPALDGEEPTDLARLRAALERDGFTVAEWDPLKEAAVPPDCAVLALIGARQPYQPATREAIRAWTESGGSLIAAPDISELYEGRAGGIVELLGSFGIVTRPGNVCQPLVGFGGEKVDGSEQCAWLVIDERGLQPGHALTEPLRARGRRVQFTLSASFESGLAAADSGVVLPLVTSAADSWRDLGPDFDFRFNPAKGEERERHTLVAIKLLRATKAADGSVKQGRILAVASAFFFDNQLVDVNRDFALNSFNWLAEREYKISVKPLEKSLSFLDFERSSVKPTLTYVLWLVLPGACAAVGLVVFLRRRS
jgi:hypothetical protein